MITLLYLRDIYNSAFRHNTGRCYVKCYNFVFCAAPIETRQTPPPTIKRKEHEYEFVQMQAVKKKQKKRNKPDRH